MSEEKEKIENEEPQEEEKEEEPEKETPKSYTEMSDEEVEKIAGAQGWRPKDRFRGDGGAEWIDAREFLKRGEKKWPIMNERNRALEMQIQENQKAMLDMKGLMSGMEKRAYEKAKREVESKMKTAKDDLDLDAYDSASQELKDLEKDKPLEPTQQEQQMDPVLVQWTQETRNRWFHEDPDLYTQAVTFYGKLETMKPWLTTHEKVMQTEDFVKQNNPQKFGVKEKPMYSSVEGGRVAPRAKKNKHDYNEIPAEDRATFDSFIKGLQSTWGQKGMDIPKETKKYKEECVINYFGEK